MATPNVRTITKKYFRDCCLIDPHAFVNATRDKIIIVIEPHPDDMMLGAGGLLQRIVKKKCEARSGPRLFAITAVSGSHAVPERLLKTITRSVERAIIARYELCYQWFLNQARRGTVARRYYERCVRNIRSLRRKAVPSDLANDLIKGGIRVFIETENAMQLLTGRRAIEHYAALLAFYDRKIGGGVDVDDSVNEFALNAIIRAIIKKTNMRKIVLFNDCGSDPHGTHGCVRSVVNRVMTRLVDRGEIEEISYYWMRGPWPLMALPGGERMCAVVYSERMHKKKIRAFNAYISQKKPLVTDHAVKDFAAYVSEENRSFARGIRAVGRLTAVRGDYAELFWVKTFTNAQGRFDKRNFKTYIKKIKG